MEYIKEQICIVKNNSSFYLCPGFFVGKKEWYWKYFADIEFEKFYLLFAKLFANKGMAKYSK